VEAQSTCGKYEVSGARKATVAATSAAPSHPVPPRAHPAVGKAEGSDEAPGAHELAPTADCLLPVFPSSLWAASPASTAKSIDNLTANDKQSPTCCCVQHPPPATLRPRSPDQQQPHSIGVKSDTTPQTQRHNLKEGSKQASKQAINLLATHHPDCQILNSNAPTPLPPYSIPLHFPSAIRPSCLKFGTTYLHASHHHHHHHQHSLHIHTNKQN
jgi:hypothetical protein